MRTHWIARGLKFAALFIALFALFSLLVMGLWNWLMPALFALHRISFWQAAGILILSRILFGGFRGWPGRNGYWRRRKVERWEQMTPEEREKFRQGVGSRCGWFRPPTPT
jgi:predicted membrane chloride channel (bestrophin family)